MPLLRYVMDLGLRVAMGVVGLGVMLFAAYTIGMSGTIMGRMAQAGEVAPLWFLLQHYGFWLAVAAGGLGLLYFGVRGLVRRVQLGLPSEEEGVGKTPLSRLGSIAIYGAALCFGLYSIGVSIVPGVQMAWLVLNGVTTTATITGFVPTDDPKYWIVKYRFTTEDGQTIDDTTFEDGYEKPSTRIISSFNVTYLADNPAQHDVTEYYSHANFVLFMVLRLAIVLVGAWGVIKNIAPMLPKGGSGVDQEPPAPAEPPRAVRTAAAGGRPNFGRRGV